MRKTKTAGIISEYNPFHNGHKYHIDETRKMCDGIIAVMSPNVCQRGEFSFFDKFSRAAAAVKCGADVVLELPCVYALSSADTFAMGGTEILSYLGAEILSFGSESGDTDMLLRAARENLRDNPEIKALLSEGLSYPRATGEYLSSKGYDLGPNDILGLRYISSGGGFKYNAVKRIGPGHDEGTPGEYMSASAIREYGIEVCKTAIPEPAREIFLRQPTNQKEKAEMLELSYLRRLKAEDIKGKPGVTEGIENRIVPALHEAGTLAEALWQVKTKRYSMARLRRLFMSLYLDMPLPPETVPYIRVLAFNKRGAEILHTAKKNCPVPIITSLCDGKKCGEAGRIISEKEGFVTDTYNFGRGVAAGEDERYSPHIL